MTKGRFGLSPSAVAVIAFGFAALRQPQSVLLVCGFALLAEKDEWLNKQAMQALLLTIVYYLAELVMSWLFGGLARLFGWIKLYSAAGAVGVAGSLVGSALYLALIVFSLLAVVRVLRGKDAGLPILANMAGGDFAAAIQPKAGAAQPVPPVQPPPFGAPCPPPPPAPAQAQYGPSPPQPPAPLPTQPVASQTAPVPTGRVCPACSAPLYEDSRFCTECGAKTE